MRILLWIILLFSLILSAIPSALGLGSYNYTGQGQFSADGTGFFNANMEDDTTATRSLTAPSQHPYVSDLDGDGINEILILDVSTIRLYHGKDLEVVDAFSLPHNVEFSNLIISDVDGDALPEVVIAEEELTANNATVFMLQYNNSEFIIDHAVNWSDGTGFVNGQVIIACRGSDDCGMILTNQRDSAATTGRVMARGFNTSDVGNVDTQETHAVGRSYCAPHIRGMSVEDYDGDGTREYISHWMKVDPVAGDDEDIRIFYFNVNKNTLAASNEMVVQDNNEYGNFATGAFDCESDHLGFYLTPPLVFDADGSISNGLETVIGFQTGTASYKMYSYESDGDFFDDYPETLSSDGIIVSNVIQANTFTDTGAVDFCIMGFTSSDNFIVLTCASEQTGQLVETDVFDFDMDGLYNITLGSDIYSNMIHAVDMSRATTDGNNLDEILTTWGVFSLDFEGLNELILEYELPVSENAPIAADAEQVGQIDILTCSATNIWYIDDGFSNSPGTIASYYIDPCIDSVWKLNTTVEIRIRAEDENNDLVTARAILYADTDNAMDSGWSINGSSGTTFTFSFTANQTGSNKIIRLMVMDSVNMEAQTLDLSFSVSTDGVVFGDCFTSVEPSPAEDGAEYQNDTITPDSENMVKQAGSELNSFLHIGLTMIWLMVMVIVDFLLIANAKEFFQRTDAHYVWMGMIVINILLFVMGAVFGFIPVWLILLLVILGITVAVIWGANKFSGSSGG